MKTVIDVVENVNDKASSPFRTWFNGIHAQAAAKITTALVRLEGGNTSSDMMALIS